MARHHILLTIAGLSLVGAAFAHDQPMPPLPPDGPQDGAPPHRRKGDDFNKFNEKAIREKLEKLPPDQRHRAMEKFRDWRDMPSDKQAHFRFMQGEREKRMQAAVDSIISSNSLTLDETQKQRITEIYKRERRKLEEQLRAEMDQKREQRLPELQQSIMKAFQNETRGQPSVIVMPLATPSPTSTPPPTP